MNEKEVRIHKAGQEPLKCVMDEPIFCETSAQNDVQNDFSHKQLKTPY